MPRCQGALRRYSAGWRWTGFWRGRRHQRRRTVRQHTQRIIPDDCAAPGAPRVPADDRCRISGLSI